MSFIIIHFQLIILVRTLSPVHSHDLSRGALLLQGSQCAHGAINEMEKGLIARVKAVQAGTIPVLGASAVAKEADVTRLACLGQCGKFGCTKFGLRLGFDQVGEGCLVDLAQEVSPVHIVIAGIQVAVVFQSQRPAAGFREDAQARGPAHILPQSDLKMLDEDPADIVPDPFIKDCAAISWRETSANSSVIILNSDRGYRFCLGR